MYSTNKKWIKAENYNAPDHGETVEYTTFNGEHRFGIYHKHKNKMVGLALENSIDTHYNLVEAYRNPRAK